MNKKITLINLIFNVVAVILYLISIPTIFMGAVAGSADIIAVLFYLFSAIGVILAVVNLIKDKQVNFRITSSILAIVGNGLFLLGAIFFIPATIVLVVTVGFYISDIIKKQNIIK